MQLIVRLGKSAKRGRFAKDENGLALIETAFALPLLIMVGVGGIELSNFAITHMRLSQIALNLADNASRVGVRSALAIQQLREADINDVFAGADMQADGLKIGEKGRMTIYSIQMNEDGGQYIAWKRCFGMKSGAGWDGSFGEVNTGRTGTAYTGFGPAGAQVAAPNAQTPTILVEFNYEYRPLINFGIVSAVRKVSYVGSYIVRDRRDVAALITNPSPAVTQMTCNRYQDEVPLRG